MAIAKVPLCLLLTSPMYPPLLNFQRSSSISSEFRDWTNVYSFFHRVQNCWNICCNRWYFERRFSGISCTFACGTHIKVSPFKKCDGVNGVKNQIYLLIATTKTNTFVGYIFWQQKDFIKKTYSAFFPEIRSNLYANSIKNCIYSTKTTFRR